MIRFNIITNDIQKAICRHTLRDLEADFFDINIDNAVFWRVNDDLKVCAVVSACCVNKTAFLGIHAGQPASDRSYRILMQAVHQVIVRYHPEEILMNHCCGITDSDMRKNMFFRIGSVYCRQTEKWRYRISDSVFDERGMIINQGELEKLPFGWFTSKTNGCGWIAAYNLFRINGREHTMENCARSLEQYGLSGKMFGERAMTLYRWLKKEGLPVRIRFCPPGECCTLMENSKSGILLYLHTRGGHYTAYENAGSGRLHFYNAVYGRQNMIMAPADFFQKYVFVPAAILIYIA